MLSIAPLTGGPGYYLALANINYYMEGEVGEPMPVYLWLWGRAADDAIQTAGDEDVVRAFRGRLKEATG